MQGWQITWRLIQWKRTYCSSWISSASHRSKVGELLWFQVAVSKRRVQTRSLKRAVIANEIMSKVKKRQVFGKWRKYVNDE